jgi:hypothetical protein
MAVKLVAAFAKEQRLDFVQFQPGVFNQWMADFHDVETKTDVIGAVTGEGIKTDFKPLHASRFFRGGFFFDGVHNGADKGNFVHRFRFVFAPALIRRSEITLHLAALLRLTNIAND